MHKRVATHAPPPIRPHRAHSTYSLVKGARFPARLNDPSALVGLRGAMYASAPAPGGCPASAAGWAALPGLALASAPSPYAVSPLDVVPNPLFANIMRLPFNLTDFAVNLTLGPAGPGGAAAAPLPVRGALAGGYTFSNTSVTGGPQLNAMTTEGPSATASAAAFEEASADGRRWLYLRLPDFSLEFKSRTQASQQFRGEGTFDFNFTGPLVLRAPLDCAKDCGDHGRCAPGARGGAATCECECGWAPSPATGACTVAQGFCSLYGGRAPRRTVRPPASSSVLQRCAGAPVCEGLACAAAHTARPHVGREKGLQ